jgi:hypothetical protein
VGRLRNNEKGPKKPVAYIDEQHELKVVAGRKIVPIIAFENPNSV